jgi:hypothetical protein
MIRSTLARAACLLAACTTLWAASAAAQGREITLAAPPELVESGFLKFVLPRFSLKTSVRVALVEPGDPAAQAALSADPKAEGRAMFTGLGGNYRLTIRDTGAEHVARFAEWLASDPGQSAIAGFQIDGAAPFGPPAKVERVVAELELDGDAERGATLSLSMCGRCHVVGEVNRLDGIGSTPSFAVLRTFPDWMNRFTGFYALNPHPAFTQVEDVTPPFDPMRPPAISPVEMSLEDLDHIVAYVARIAPADLGAPIQAQ